MDSPQDSNPIIAFVRRRMFSLTIIVAAAAVGAFAIGNKYSAQTWSCTATLLYNRSNLGEPHYRQPQAQSIVTLFKSRAALETLVREFKLPPNLAGLAASIQAEIVFDSNTIQLTMRGNDPQQTQAMLDRLIQSVTAQAAQLRHDALATILAERKKNLADAKLGVERTYRELEKFYAANRIVSSVEDDLNRVRDDIAAAERAAEIDRPAMLSPQDELQRRRSALQDQLDGQRETIVRDSALALKKNEYERAARLHAKRYISDAEFRRVESEYRALEAQNAAAMRESQDRIAEVDRKLNERLARSVGGLADGDDANTPQARAERARLEAFLAQRRAEAERLSLLRGPEADLQQAVASAQADVTRLNASLAMFQEFLAAPFDDLTIVQPAAPALEPVSSNKKKVLVGAFLALLGLGLTPVLAWDTFRTTRPMQNKPTAASLPTPAKSPSAATTTSHESNRHEVVRALALRIQQLPTQHGAVVLLNHLDDAAAPVEAAIATAECLHRRGEKVLVVDVTGDPGVVDALCKQTVEPTITPVQVVDEWIQPPGRRAVHAEFASQDYGGTTATAVAATAQLGWADWLADERLELRAMIRRGTAFDVLTPGDAALPEEAFAGRRFTGLFDQLRSQYGDVLVLGPGVYRRVDLELLAARADGLAFVVESGRSPSAAGERTWNDLVALKAPLLGRFEI